MFNFIVYEDEEKFREKYHYIILKFIGDSNLAYKIIDISKYTKEEAERMLAFSNNSGPLFILGTVGITLFANSTIGFLLLITHILAFII